MKKKKNNITFRKKNTKVIGLIKDGKDGKIIAKIPEAKSKIYAHKV